MRDPRCRRARWPSRICAGPAATLLFVDGELVNRCRLNAN
jgi:hypothetical protein